MIMATRKIKKSYISCTGYFASVKNKKLITFESTLERDFFTILEFDSNVKSYEEQPMTVKYNFDDDEIRKYTPDVLVKYTDGTKKLFEVKYANDLQDKNLVYKLNTLKKYFSENENIDLNIFTDKEVAQSILNNYKFLYKFASLKPSKKTTIIEKTIVENSPLSIKELLHKLSTNKNEQLFFIPYIWNYLYKNIYLIEHELLHTTFTMNTKIIYGV